MTANGDRKKVLTTRRLRLEPCAPEHLPGLHALNADPQVMRYVTGQPETVEQTRAMIERVQARWAEFGYSWWSFIELATGELVGAGCIQNLRRGDSPVPDPSCPLEIGWRLRRDRWHQGLATEAARTMAAFAFDELKAPHLYAVCDPDNVASAAVMRRLGMESLGLDTWYGRTLATYRIAAEVWEARRPALDLGEGSTNPRPRA
ncbi:MAG TPA: GNAT family N-acetyltransferase [Albitalea sp.]|nr:GNAT family N-acetyltransferase [Albitalea sp.]